MVKGSWVEVSVLCTSNLHYYTCADHNPLLRRVGVIAQDNNYNNLVIEGGGGITSAL